MNPKTVLAVYALLIAAFVVWWATTESMIALVLLLVTILVAAVHVIKLTGSTRGRTQHSIDEGHARSGFPRPPEGPRPS